MSSEEVAELAQAIHTHADALYDSWTKPQPDQILKRMEDTLELLADPNLTPKLEHLVSTFVRRDKAKRQQQNTTIHINRQNPSPQMTFSKSESPTRDNHVMSSPGHSNGQMNLMNVKGSNSSSNSKKPLPKSILAVVQRFEPSPEKNPEIPPPQPMSMPGPKVTVIPVTKNVVWAESSKRQKVTEKSMGTHTPPLIVIRNKLITNSLNNDPTSPLGPSHIQEISMSTTKVKPIERNIPIKLDEPPDMKNSNYCGPVYLQNNARDIPVPKEVQTQVEHTRKIREIQNEPLNARGIPYNEILNMRGIQNQNIGPKEIYHEVILTKSDRPEIQELEIEEERLFSALRTGKVINELSGSNSLELLREKSHSSIVNNNSPRIAFAKERIRQSQEHPLTQQRLELQKRLPSPSVNLASAMAVQQGKIRFQTHPEYHHGGHFDEHGHPVMGRQSWVSNILKFGSGSSVADRVQLFEKYPPHVLNHHLNQGIVGTFPSPIVQTFSELQVPPPQTQQVKELPSFTSRKNVKSNAPWRNTAENHNVEIIPIVKAFSRPAPKYLRKYENVPKFYWPEGKPPPISYIHESIAKAETEVSKFLHSPITLIKFGQLLSNIGIPLYWKKPFWMALGLKEETPFAGNLFLSFYRRMISECPDDASRFIRLLSTASRNSPVWDNNTSHLNHQKSQDNESMLHMSDFIPIIQDIIDTHPGLGFLRDAPEFHSRYVTTVISRIFYKVNRSWTGRMTLPELRRSNLLRIIKRLEEETDVNTITEYFSYEHFYVIYCKFWELDKDHDLLIDRNDLASHSDHALSSRIIDRIFSGTVIRGWDVSSPVKCTPGKMTYSDFVWFLLSEEDKKTPTAIEYWFRCLDLDGDGILSPYELQYFYSEQESRIECLGIEPLDFTNVYCQILDMLHCANTGIRLKDLKGNCSLAANMFNTLFNLDKYLDHEQRDPFATATSTYESQEEMENFSDWDKYATTEYELLISEETSSETHIEEVI